MVGALQREYKFIEGAAVIGNAAIDTIFNVLRPGYEPVLWGAGTDRLKAYDNQIKKYNDELNCLPEFEMYEIKRNDDDVSASKVREALKRDDEKEFKAMTPSSLHKMYTTLKEIIQDVKESFGLLSFSEF